MGLPAFRAPDGNASSSFELAVLANELTHAQIKSAMGNSMHQAVVGAVLMYALSAPVRIHEPHPTSAVSEDFTLGYDGGDVDM